MGVNMHVTEYRKLVKKKTKKRSLSGKREDLDNMFFRSKWEANYARYLNFLIKAGEIEKWDYEQEEFKFPVTRGNMYYKCDFRVFYSDRTEYHEVKGYMDNDSRVKLKRMAKYYPEIKIKVIGAQWFRDNNRLKKLLPSWE